MKKDFDLLLKVVVEEYADTLQCDKKKVEDFILKLYKEALIDQ